MQRLVAVRRDAYEQIHVVLLEHVNGQGQVKIWGLIMPNDEICEVLNYIPDDDELTTELKGLAIAEDASLYGLLARMAEMSADSPDDQRQIRRCEDGWIELHFGDGQRVLTCNADDHVDLDVREAFTPWLDSSRPMPIYAAFLELAEYQQDQEN